MAQNKKITVKEIKEIEPKAEVFELNKHCQYMVMIKKSALVGGDAIARQKGQIVMELMKQMNIPCAVLIGVDDDVKFLELS